MAIDVAAVRRHPGILLDILVLSTDPGGARCYSSHIGRIERVYRLLAAGAGVSRAQIQALCRSRDEAALGIYARLSASDTRCGRAEVISRASTPSRSRASRRPTLATPFPWAPPSHKCSAPGQEAATVAAAAASTATLAA